MALIFVGVSPHTEVCHLTVKTRLCFQSHKTHPTRRGDWSRDQSLLAFGTLCSSQGSVSVACRVPLTSARRFGAGFRRATVVIISPGGRGRSSGLPLGLGRTGKRSAAPWVCQIGVPRSRLSSVKSAWGAGPDRCRTLSCATGNCNRVVPEVSNRPGRCLSAAAASASCWCGAGRCHLSATAGDCTGTGPLVGNSCAHSGRSTHR